MFADTNAAATQIHQSKVTGCQDPLSFLFSYVSTWIPSVCDHQSQSDKHLMVYIKLHISAPYMLVFHMSERVKSDITI